MTKTSLPLCDWDGHYDAERAKLDAELAKLLGKEGALMLRAKYAIHRFENLRRNPLKMHEVVPLIRKELNRAKAEKHLAAANLKRSQNAQAERQKYHDIIVRLYRTKPEWRRASRERLAREVRTALARQGITKSTKTIKRALPPKK